MVDTPLDDFIEDSLIDLQQLVSHPKQLKEVSGAYIWNWNGFRHGLLANILHHILD